MTTQQIAIAVVVGFTGSIFWVEFFRPIFKGLITRFQKWRNTRHVNRLQRAYSAGYGWAWSYVVIEDNSIPAAEEQLEASSLGSHREKSQTSVWFDDGAERALKDIEYFQCLKEERE